MGGGIKDIVFTAYDNDPWIAVPSIKFKEHRGLVGSDQELCLQPVHRGVRIVKS